MNSKLHLALSTKAFGALPLEDIYMNIAKTGIRFVHLDLQEETNLEDVISAQQVFKKLGLKLVQISSRNFPKSYTDEKHYSEAIDEVKKLIEVQKVYDNATVSLTAGSYRGKKEEHIEASVKFMKKACELADGEGIKATLYFIPKKNQLIKTWQEMTDFYEKVANDNLLLNLNTAALHHLEVSDEDLEFAKEKAALLVLQDIEDKNWNVKINLGEGIADISSWTERVKPLIENTCTNKGLIPTSVVTLQSDEACELKRTLRYLESVLPQISM